MHHAFDNRIEIFRNRQTQNEATNADMENRGDERPDQFDFCDFDRFEVQGWPAGMMPDFRDDAPPYPFMHEFQVAVAEVETPIKSEEQVQSDPFVFHDQPRVVLIKMNEAIA